jgi:hypothetical protein
MKEIYHPFFILTHIIPQIIDGKGFVTAKQFILQSVLGIEKRGIRPKSEEILLS